MDGRMIGLECYRGLEACNRFCRTPKGAKGSATIAVGGSIFGIDPDGKRELSFALSSEAALEIDNAECVRGAEMCRISL
jgi:hypothetical protein